MKQTQIKLGIGVVLFALVSSAYALCYKPSTQSCTSECNSACSNFGTPTWSNGVKGNVTASGTGTGNLGTNINPNGDCVCDGHRYEFGTIATVNGLPCGPVNVPFVDTGSATCQF